MGAGIVVGNVKHNELDKELEFRGPEFVLQRCLLAHPPGLKITLWKMWKEVRNCLERICAEVGIPDADVSWAYDISRLRLSTLILRQIIRIPIR